MALRSDFGGVGLDGTALMKLGSWAHLAGRFFSVATAAPLTDREREEVEGWLNGPGEAAAFWDQPVADQRHGWEAGRRLAARCPERRDLIRAALLHDVGKRHANLGLVGRSLASFIAKVGLRARGSWQRYLEHGPRGADELAGLGAEPIVVGFTRYHHGERPAGISPDDWRVLKEADR